MTKRFLALLLALVMVLSLLPVSVIAEGEGTAVTVHTDESHICEQCETAAVWTAWDGTEAMTDGGHYVLTGSVTLSAPVALSEGTYTLCLNGQTITGSTTLFDLSGTASLIITDCTAKMVEDVYTAGKLTGATKSAVRASGDAVFTMYDGIFTGNHNDSTATTEGGGAVNASGNAEINLLGGELRSNTSAKYGGAVFARNYAKITVQNMLIIGNETQVASALYGTGGVQYTIIDSVITGNTGTHTSATNAGYAAAVHMSGSGVKLTVSGKVVIADNIVKSGNTKVADLVFAKATDKLYVNELAEGSNIVFSTPAIAISGSDVSKLFAVEGSQGNWNPHWVSYVNSEGGKEFVSMTSAGKFLLGHYHDDQLYTAISDNVGLRDLEGYGYLTKDLNLGGPQTRKKDCTICLNGYTITAKKNTRLFTTEEAYAANVTIQDCTAYTDEEGVYHAGKLTGGSNKDSGGAILIVTGNTINLEDGILTGNTCLAAGGVVQIKGGTFNMSGGEISDNKPANAEGTVQNAGAILIAEDGTFNLSGGKITGNEAANGGAIYVAKGTMNMSGGELCGNKASVNGGAIYVAANGVLNITGGKLCHNETGTHGGAIYVATNGGFSMADAEVCNNTAGNNGGGLYLLKLGTAITGSKITGNTATNAGGGLYLNGTTATMTDVIASGNKAVNGGGIYVNAPGADDPYPAVLTVNGASAITGNVATTSGGGIYVGPYCKLTLTDSAAITGNDADVAGSGVFIANETVTTTLSGDIIVSENENNNMHLEGEAMLTVDNLGENAKVGITASVTQRYFAEPVTEAQLAQFPSDKDNCVILFEEGKLFIGVISDHQHCACGASQVGCDHSTIEYIPWEKSNALPASGNYYLTSDVTLSAEASITGNLNLCLNGFTVKAAEGDRILSTVAEEITLVISDCTAAEADGVYTAGQLTGGYEKELSGGAIYLRAGSTLKLYDGIITGNSSDSFGGAISVTKNAALELYGGEISGNTTAGNGAGIYAATDSKFVMAGGSIRNNVADGNGGGVYLVKLTTELNGGEISGNEAKKDGGGLYLNGTVITVNKTAITGNKAAANGGAIYANNPVTTDATTGVQTPYPAKITLNADAKITGNEALNAGAIYVNRSELTVSGGSISENKSQTTAGGVYVSADATMTMASGAVEKNTAKQNGGGIYCATGSAFTMKGGSVNNNYTEANGGGIYLLKITPVITGGEISGNEAKKDGGGLYLNGTTLVLENVTISGNKANLGGGFYANNPVATDATTGVQTPYPADITLNKGAKITGNEGYTGGGIYVNRSKLTISGGELSSNKSQTTAGGAYISVDATLNFTDGNVVNNTSVANGAGLYCATGSDFVMTGGLVKGNITEANGGGMYLLKITTAITGGEISGNEAAKDGGGIYLNGTKVTLENVAVSDNKATNGGGIYANNPVTTDATTGVQTPYPADLTLKSGAKITGNEAHTAGGIYMNRSKLTVSGGSISENTSESTAGGVYVSVNATMDLNDGAIEKNTAKQNGGGIYCATGSAFAMKGGSVKNNSSESNGGGLYILKIETTFEDGQIVDNEAVGDGGGMYCNGTKVTINKLTVSGNKAVAGAGIYAKSVSSANAETGQDELFPAIVKLGKDVEIKNNNASKNGGGICVTGKESMLEMTGGTISGNYGKNAGGVLVMGKGTFKMTGGSVSGNNANSGGGVYISTGSAMNLSGGTISGNTATKNGGGIYMLRSTNSLGGGTISGNAGESGGAFYASGATVNLTGTYISGNTAVKNGGAAMGTVSSVTTNGVKDVAYTQINMSGGVITQNTAVNAGGIIVQSKGCALNLSGGKITENTATSSGGGVYISTNGTINMSGGEVSHNTAKASGGIHHNKSIGNYTGGAVLNNVAETGGGMTIGGGQTCDVKIEKLLIQGNEAARAGGGILQQGNSKLHLGAAEIIDNVSGKIGGGLCISSKTHATLDGTIFRNNTGKTEGGAFYVYTASSATCENLTIEGNHSVNAGGGVFSRGRLILKNSVVEGNTTDGNGGGIGTYRVGTNRIGKSSYMTLENVEIKNNTSNGLGGGVYLSMGHPAEMKNVTISDNTASAEGGGIWSACHLNMDSLTVTGNVSGGEGYALYLGETDYDGQSFVRGVLQMQGDMVVRDNKGGDMLLGADGVISIPGGSMGEDTYVHINLVSGVLTQHVLGFYDYEGGDQDYIITAGDRSVTDPEQVETEGETEETTTEPESAQTDEDESKLSGALIAGIGGIVLVVAAAAALIVLLAKKKKTVQK